MLIILSDWEHKFSPHYFSQTLVVLNRSRKDTTFPIRD